MTRVLRKKMYLEESEDCVVCSKGEEDCKHLFFQCPMAHVIGVTQGIPWVDATCEKVF